MARPLFVQLLNELGMDREMEILTPENIGMLLYEPEGRALDAPAG